MSDRPILFSAPMIRALLAGTKTQTRRGLKPQPERTSNGSWHVQWQVGGGSLHAADATDADIAAEIWEGLRIQAGDRLWVREAVRAVENANAGAGLVFYCADGTMRQIDNTPEAVELWGDLLCYRGKRGATVGRIHMPRWASRLTLTVTDVRVQRLQDISADDALAEGVSTTDFWRPKDVEGRPFEEKWWDDLTFWQNYPQIAYAHLWDSINGAGSWARNDWVAAYSFSVEHRNIDAPTHEVQS